jgi:hypothetical protein
MRSGSHMGVPEADEESANQSERMLPRLLGKRIIPSDEEITKITRLEHTVGPPRREPPPELRIGTTQQNSGGPKLDKPVIRAKPD